jgi:hypothetical protein
MRQPTDLPKKTLRMPAPPLKNNKSSSATTTKMFADIVQKTQNKTALRQQKLLFSKNLQPKKTEKNFTKITKDLY